MIVPIHSWIDPKPPVLFNEFRRCAFPVAPRALQGDIAPIQAMNTPQTRLSEVLGTRRALVLLARRIVQRFRDWL